MRWWRKNPCKYTCSKGSGVRDMGNSQQPCLDLVFLTFNRGFILHPKKSHLFLLMLIITKCWIQMSIQGAESLGFCAQAKRKESTVPLGTAALPSQWKEAEQAWPWAKGCTNKVVLRGMGKASRQSCLKWFSNYIWGWNWEKWVFVQVQD